MNIHKLLHPILKKIISIQCNKKIIIMNDIKSTSGNVIYAINHSNKYDMPIAAEIINQHIYILVGRQKLELIDYLFFVLNGTVWVDRKEKSDRGKAKATLEMLLKKGNRIAMFPEGTWNLTPSSPMLPLYWGIIDIAKNTQSPIVPLVLEYKGDKVYAKFGRPMVIMEEDDKGEKIKELSDVMATLKWDIWEELGVSSRNEIEEDEWEKEVQKRVKEYPKLDYEYEKSCVRATN